MSTGFMLKRLVVRGPRRQPAQLDFEGGLNIVRGGSDSGKSYTFECIDHCLGAKTELRDIAESEGYDEAALTIETASGDTYVVTRRFGSKKAIVTDPSGHDHEYNVQHKRGHDSLSTFYLDRCGLAGHRVRKNQQGATKDVSFRNVVKFFLVDEDSVHSHRSPILGPIPMDHTAEQGFFRLLITGEDDSDLASEGPESRLSRGRRLGRTDLLETLIERNAQHLKSVNAPESLEAAEVRSAGAQDEVRRARQDLAEVQRHADELEKARQAAWKELRRLDGRRLVLDQLDQRFALLEAQYATDRRRLDVVADVTVQLEQMGPVRCPVCGAPGEFHEHETDDNYDLALVARACVAEIGTLTSLEGDLAATRADTAREIKQLTQAITAQRASVDAVEGALANDLQPNIAAAVSRFEQAETQRGEAETAVALLRNARELREMLKENQRSQVQVDSKVISSISEGDLAAFARTAERVLRGWGVPKCAPVTFDKEALDLRLAGRSRAARGKGVRALTNTAFTLALLRFGLDAGLPAPGFAVIDSPLVAYRQGDPAEDADDPVPVRVKEEFYRDTMRDFVDAQVIVFEHEAPPTDVESGARIIWWPSGSGFFPSAE